ncbi:MAG: PLDc N-terminal domain-containing protein [Specibacter sp.]
MDVNPVVPIGFEILGWVSGALYLGTLLWALVTLAKAQSLTAGARISWLAFIVIVPFIGSTAWLAFLVTRRSGKQVAK